MGIKNCMLLFCVLQVFLVSCRKEDGAPLTLYGKGVEISFPVDWITEKLDENHLIVSSKSPSKDIDDNFQEYIAITEVNLDGYDLDSYYNENIDLLIYLEGYEFVSSFDIKINAINGKRRIYKAKGKIVGSEEEVEFQFISYFFFYKDYGYHVLCSSKVETYNEFKYQFESIVETFKLHF